MAENDPIQMPMGGTLQIYEDAFEPSAPMTSHAPMPTVSKGSRAPLGSAGSNVVFNAPNPLQLARSPTKQRASRPLGHKHKTSYTSPTRHGLSAGNANRKPYLSQFKTSHHKFSDAIYHGKENESPVPRPSTSSSMLPLETTFNVNGKRSLMEAAPISDSRPQKKAKSTDQVAALPPHDSFPPIPDDGSKPSHSYAQLIGMAILRSPQRRLTLAQIYKWISTTFSFYLSTDMGWQNSIRHNLSLHRNFIKTERPKDDPGKGHYWTIQPGTEMQFLKEKPSRKSAPTAENLPVMSTRLEPSEPFTAPMHEPSLPPPPLPPHTMGYNMLPELPTSQATIQLPAEASSDATIPASDQVLFEEPVDRPAPHDAALEAALYPALATTLQSSPPVPRSRDALKATSPILTHKSRPKESREIVGSLEDSGYISSLESSAMRPNQRPPKSHLLTSGAERKRMKRGRAEEEIARLRNSSPYSPTKSRSLSTYHPVSSSPLRQAHDRSALAPVTPKVAMFKQRIFEPPASVSMFMSPNKSLALHRSNMSKLLGSPVRDMSSTAVTDDGSWGSGLRLHEPTFLDHLMVTKPDLDFFGSADFGSPLADLANIGDPASPLSRSSHRRRLPRSVSDSNLANSNAIVQKDMTELPSLADKFDLAVDTPSKFFEGLSSPSKMLPPTPCRIGTSSRPMAGLADMSQAADWTGLIFEPNEFLEKDSSTLVDFPGFDMLQGFERIGSGKPAQPKSGRSPKKPQFGRSTTSKF